MVLKLMENFFKASPDEDGSRGLRPCFHSTKNKSWSPDLSRLFIVESERHSRRSLALWCLACHLMLNFLHLCCPFAIFPALLHAAFLTFLLRLLFPVLQLSSLHSPFSFCCWIRDILLSQRQLLFRRNNQTEIGAALQNTRCNPALFLCWRFIIVV